MSNTLTLLRSPTQASDIYSGTGAFPKQRHVFLVRFNLNGGSVISNLTFAIKSVDRPSIQPTVEELSQYNKKRQIYTGYKTSPLKIEFYDSADQAALGMFDAYSRYYFGDFSQSGPSMFSGQDIYGPQMMDPTMSYGLVAVPSPTADTQYFFRTIDILHFHDGQYDQYELVNPRISGFDPSGLDYEAAEVATIDMAVVYEAIFFTPNAGAGASVPEMQPGSLFYGNPLPVVGSNEQPALSSTYNPNVAYAGASEGPAIATILSSLYGASAGVAGVPVVPFRYYGGPTGGALGPFGSYVFGQAPQAGGFVATALTGAAYGDPALATTLSLGYGPDGFSGSLSLAGAASVPTGLPSAAGAAISQVGGAIYGAETAFSNSVAQGVAGAAAVAAQNGIPTPPPFYQAPSGVMLSPDAYAMINARGAGTAQIGYNINSNPATGAFYGYNGPTGYLGPSGQPAPPTLPAPPLDRSYPLAGMEAPWTTYYAGSQSSTPISGQNGSLGSVDAGAIPTATPSSTGALSGNGVAIYGTSGGSPNVPLGTETGGANGVGAGFGTNTPSDGGYSDVPTQGTPQNTGNIYNNGFPGN